MVIQKHRDQLELDLSDGHCNGPLFAPIRTRRPPLRRPGVWTDHGRMRRAAEARARPPWFSIEPVRDLYREAEHRTREGPIVWSVGHIVPLLSRWVCGLHWHGNMQLETLEENMRRGNRGWPDMWEEQLSLL